MVNGRESHRLQVIVAGYGPVGRFVTEKLEQAGADVTIIETNEKTVEGQQKLGKRVILGDATEESVLRAAGIEKADALVLAMPDEDIALRACKVARECSPKIFIAARTNFLSKGLMAAQAGADHVTIEEVVTAEAMQRAVVERLCGR